MFSSTIQTTKNPITKAEYAGIVMKMMDKHLKEYPILQESDPDKDEIHMCDPSKEHNEYGFVFMKDRILWVCGDLDKTRFEMKISEESGDHNKTHAEITFNGSCWALKWICDQFLPESFLDWVLSGDIVDKQDPDEPGCIENHLRFLRDLLPEEFKKRYQDADHAEIMKEVYRVCDKD
jgi:hypothetical protein